MTAHARVVRAEPVLGIVITAPGLLTREQAAKYLNVSLETFTYWVYRLCAVPRVQVGPRHKDRGATRFRVSDLDALIRDIPAAPDAVKALARRARG